MSKIILHFFLFLILFNNFFRSFRPMFFFFDLKVQSVLKIRLLQKNQKGFFHNSPTPLRPKRGFNLSLNPFPIIGKGLN